MSEAAVPERPPDRSMRIYVLWAVGFALLALLGGFCWFFLRPYVQVRAAAKRCSADKGCTAAEIARLGGPAKAPGPIAFYLRLPLRLAPYRYDAVLLLGACGRPAADDLLRLTRDPDCYVRGEATLALGETGDARAIPLLVAMLGDPVEARIMSPWAEVEDLGRLWAFDWSEPPSGDPERALVALGQQAVQPMIDTLKIGNAMGRRRAAETLGWIGDRRAVEPLIAMLADRNKEARREAIVALGRIGGPGVFEHLAPLLADKEASYPAAFALGILGDRRAVGPLEKLAAGKEDEWARWAAERALKRIREEQAKPDAEP